MDRRRFLGGLGVAGVGAAACSPADFEPRPAQETATGPAIVRRRRELRMVTTWPKGFPGLGTAAERVAERITALSDGALTVNLFAAGELAPAFESLDAVAGGAADMYHGAEYYWQGKSPGFSFFTGVPFGLTSAELMAWIRHGGGAELWRELSARFGVIAFEAGNSGHQLGGWYKREIRSLDDMRGLTIRMPGLGGDVIARLGATPKLLSGGEIYQALQTGAIDGTEWVGPWNDLAFGFYREAPYYYWPGFHEPGTALACGINLSVWESFSDTEKAIVTYACRSVNDDSIAEFAHQNARALTTLVEEHGVRLRRFPDDVLMAAARAARKVLAETAERDDITRRIYESYTRARGDLSRWSAIGDAAFLAARAAAEGRAP